MVLLVSGCSGGSDNDNDDGASGSACQQWQTAICNFAERCGGDAVTCREQAPAIACLSEAEATRCTAEFNSGACTTLPSGCDLGDIADPAPAIAKCNGFIEALCNKSEECEPGSSADCLAAASGSLDCSLALGIKPEYDQCLSEVAASDCAATAGPPTCQGVILLSQ